MDPRDVSEWKRELRESRELEFKVNISRFEKRKIYLLNYFINERR